MPIIDTTAAGATLRTEPLRTRSRGPAPGARGQAAQRHSKPGRAPAPANTNPRVRLPGRGSLVGGVTSLANPKRPWPAAAHFAPSAFALPLRSFAPSLFNSAFGLRKVRTRKSHQSLHDHSLGSYSLPRVQAHFSGSPPGCYPQCLSQVQTAQVKNCPEGTGENSPTFQRWELPPDAR